MKVNPERGSGKMGCLFMLLVMAILVYLAVNISPIYVAKINFQDDLNKLTSKAGANGWSERMIKAEVIKLAEDMDFEVAGEGIQVSRKQRFEQAARITITVNISRPFSMPGFSHVFKFTCTSTGLIGTL